MSVKLSTAITPCVYEVAKELYAKGLIPFDLKDKIIYSNETEARKADVLVNSIERLLLAFSGLNQEEHMESVCTVLRNQDQEPLNLIITSLLPSGSTSVHTHTELVSAHSSPWNNLRIMSYQLSTTIIPFVHEIANEVNVKRLIGNTVKENLMFGDESLERKADKLVIELERALRCDSDHDHYLEQLCSVLSSQGDPKLNEISTILLTTTLSAVPKRDITSSVVLSCNNNRDLISERLRSMTVHLCDAITPCVYEVVQELHAKGLIENYTKEEIISRGVNSNKASRLLCYVYGTLEKTTEPEQYLKKLCTVLKNQGQRQLLEITEFLNPPDYAALLNNAMKDGFIEVKWSKFSLSGPPGSGKSSFLDLLQGKDPSTQHQSTAVGREAEVRLVETNPFIMKEGAETWEPINIELLKKMTAKEIKKHHSTMTHEPHTLYFTDTNTISTNEEKTSSSHNVPLSSTESEPINTINDETVHVSSADNAHSNNDASYENTPNNNDTMLNYVSEAVHDFRSHCLSDVHFVYGVDSGGQAAFLDIIPALLRYKSVNILAHKMDESLNDPAKFFFCVNNERVGEPIQRQETHLNLLQTFLRSSTAINPSVLEYVEEAGGSPKPIFVVLGTFLDKIDKENFSDKNKLLWENFSSFVTDSGILVCYKEEKEEIIFPIKTVDRGEETKAIAERIRSLIQKHYIKAKVPLRWFQFQLELESLKAGGQKIISKESCEEIGSRKAGMNSQEVDTALQYYTDLTVFLYFPEIDIVFLHPQPLFDMLSKLIQVSFTDNAIDNIHPGAHTNLKNYGKFDRTLLECLESFFIEGFSANKFLTLMQSLLVIAPLSEEKDQYFLPCVLPSCDIDQLQEIKKPFQSYCDSLLFVLTGDSVDVKVLPQGFFPALIVELLHNTQYKLQFVKGRPFRNVVLLHSIKLGIRILLIDNFTSLKVCSNKKYFIVRSLIREAMESVIDKIQYNEYNSLDIENGFICSNNSDHICIVSEDKTSLICTSGCFPLPSITEHQQNWFTSLSSTPSIILFKSRTAYSVLKMKISLIKQCQIGLEFLADKMLERGIINESKKREVLDMMTGQTTDQRIDILLVELRTTVLKEASVFGWFIQILQEDINTLRSRNLAESLISQYNKLDKFSNEPTESHESKSKDAVPVNPSKRSTNQASLSPPLPQTKRRAIDLKEDSSFIDNKPTTMFLESTNSFKRSAQQASLSPPLPQTKQRALDSEKDISLIDNTHNKPTTVFLSIEELRDVINILKLKKFSHSEWRKLGLQLGLYYNTLDNIESDKNYKAYDCLETCLAYWLQKKDGVENDGGPTWKQLARVLRNMEENSVAEYIEQTKLN